MSWFAQYLTVQHIQRERDRALRARRLEHEARSGRRSRTALPPFGRIRRPTARLLMAVGAVASQAALVIDPRASHG